MSVTQDVDFDSIPLGRIVVPRYNVDYQITPEDELWGLRMIVGEGGPDALEVLQTMAQRWLWMKVSGARKVEQLWTLYRPYSQPINDWYARGGKKCPTAKPNPPKGVWEACSEAALRRRDFYQGGADGDNLNHDGASIEELYAYQGGRHAKHLDAARAWFRGLVTTDKVPGAVHFAATFVTMPKVRAGKEVLVHKGINVFTTIPKTRNHGGGPITWPVDLLRVTPGSGRVGGSNAVVLGALIGGALVVFVTRFDGLDRLKGLFR